MRKPVLRVQNEKKALSLQKIYDYFIDIENREMSFDELTHKEIEEYQEMALTVILEYAIENNDYYKLSMINKNSCKLSDIPFLSKKAIRGEKNLIQCCEDSASGQLHLTSGTTGTPTYITYTLNDQYIYDLLPQYSNLFPYTDKDVIGIALPYEFALPALAFQRLFQFVFGSMCLSLGKGGYMAPIDKVLDLLNVYKPSVVATTPSYAALLYDEAKKSNYDVKNFGIKHFILTGEGCSYTFRNRLENIWSAKMYFFYGSTEIGLIGKECIEQQGYHICEAHVIVEVVDESGNVLPNGRPGELVITTLLREGMPMIRYKTGDKGYILESNCSCGCEMKKLFLLGRDCDQLKIDDVKISPYVLENILLQSKNVSLWYQFQVKNNKLTINCENISNTHADADVIREVETLFREGYDIECKVDLSNSIPKHSSKNQRVFNN